MEAVLGHGTLAPGTEWSLLRRRSRVSRLELDATQDAGADRIRQATPGLQWDIGERWPKVTRTVTSGGRFQGVRANPRSVSECVLTEGGCDGWWRWEVVWA